MPTEPQTRPIQTAAAAAVVLVLAATMAAGRPAPAVAPAALPTCWSAAPADLAPLACGEHGALAGVAGA
jgi:hypothetical protein